MNLNLASEYILAANGLSTKDLFSILSQLTERGLDYGDIYFQSRQYESWVLENSIIKNGFYNVITGVGIRSIKGVKTSFAYADQISLAALKQSVQTIRDSTTHGNGNGSKIKNFKKVRHTAIYSNINPLQSISLEEKISILHRVDRVARTSDCRVQEVFASLSGIYELILVVDTDGTLAADIRPLVLLTINVLIEKDGKREYGLSGGGGRFNYNWFLEKDDFNGDVRIDGWAKEAVRMASVNLFAIPAPAGTLPVVLGSGWPGVLLHEAVGHGLEGDFNRCGSSVFSNKIGELVASPLCTIVDDGSLYGRSGSLSIDDEGTPGRCNILIENGILKRYMQDKLNARLMGVTSTGNSRRESYAHLPIPRMTNTYMLPRQYSPQDIIASVDYGIYVPNFSGGEVNITSGKFVFSASEAYLIKKGRVTKPIKGATLIGSGIETMQSVSMVGNDLKIDNGLGFCSKNGQNLPVSVGQPTLKIDNLTIGGTV